MPRVVVEAAGETAFADFEIPAASGPVVGATAPDFAVPAGALTATAATFTSVYSGAAAGATIVCRGGVYPTNINLAKAMTIQRYPGEEVAFDGLDQARWVIVKAAVTFRGITFRNFRAPADSVFEYGIMMPTGGSGVVFEQCRFSGFKGSAWRVARSPLYFFNDGALTVRSCTFEAAAQGHIYVAKCTSLLIERSLFLDANQDGQQMEPVTAAIKVSPSSGNLARNVVIRDNIIDGVKVAAGIWFDTDVVAAKVHRNVLTRVENTGIYSEACVGTLYVGNKVTGGDQPIRVLDSPDVRIWENEATGGRLCQVVVRQDERRNTNSVGLGQGSTWVTRNVEIVNNTLGLDYQTFQIDTMDDGPASYTPISAAADMVARVEGNTMPRNTTRGTQVGWNTKQRTRQNFTIEQLEAAFPAIARNNATPRKATVPAEIAALMGPLPVRA